MGNRLKAIILAGVALCSVAATPLFSTKVNESLKSMLSSDGKFHVIKWDTGETDTRATLVGSGTGDMTKAVYDSNNDGVIAVPQGGTGITTLTAGLLLFGNGTGALLSDSGISWDNATKRLTVTGWSGTPVNATTYITCNSLNISPTELGYLDGASSNLQTQIDSKLTAVGGSGSNNTFTSPTITTPTVSNGTWDGGSFSNFTLLGNGLTSQGGWTWITRDGDYNLYPSPGYVLTLGTETTRIPKATDIPSKVDTAGAVGIDTSTGTGSAIVFYGGLGTCTAIPSYYSKSVVIEYPGTSTDILIWRSPSQITIRNIHLQTTGGISSAGMLEQWNSNGAALVSSVDSSNITANVGTNANDDGTLSNPVIASGNYLYWNFSAIAGTPTASVITYEYTYDTSD